MVKKSIVKALEAIATAATVYEVLQLILALGLIAGAVIFKIVTRIVAH
jgi:hypothetical protein